MRTARCAIMPACVTRVCLHFFTVTNNDEKQVIAFTEHNLSSEKCSYQIFLKCISLRRWIHDENLLFFLCASRVSFQAAGCKFNDDEFFMKSAVCFAIPAKCKT